MYREKGERNCCKMRRFSQFSSAFSLPFRAFFSMCAQCHCSCQNLIRIFLCVDVWKRRREPEKNKKFVVSSVRSLLLEARWQKSHTKLVSIWICDMMITIRPSAFNSSFKVVVFILLDKNFPLVSKYAGEEQRNWLIRPLSRYMHLSWLLIVFLDQKCIIVRVHADEMWHFTRNEEWYHPLLRATMMHVQLLMTSRSSAGERNGLGQKAWAFAFFGFEMMWESWSNVCRV